MKTIQHFGFQIKLSVTYYHIRRPVQKHDDKVLRMHTANAHHNTNAKKGQKEEHPQSSPSKKIPPTPLSFMAKLP